MDPLPTLDELDARLTDLEVKSAYAEDTVEALNQVVIRQQAQIDLLVRELQRLRAERPSGDDLPGAPRQAADDRPPHY